MKYKRYIFYLYFKWTCIHTYVHTYEAAENWNSETKKKYDKAPKIHFTEILLFENVTFRDIWGYAENSNAISGNGKKGE